MNKVRLYHVGSITLLLVWCLGQFTFQHLVNTNSSITMDNLTTLESEISTSKEQNTHNQMHIDTHHFDVDLLNDEREL